MFSRLQNAIQRTDVIAPETVRSFRFERDPRTLSVARTITEVGTPRVWRAETRPSAVSVTNGLLLCIGVISLVIGSVANIPLLSTLGVAAVFIGGFFLAMTGPLRGVLCERIGSSLIPVALCRCPYHLGELATWNITDPSGHVRASITTERKTEIGPFKRVAYTLRDPDGAELARFTTPRGKLNGLLNLTYPLELTYPASDEVSGKLTSSFSFATSTLSLANHVIHPLPDELLLAFTVKVGMWSK